MVRMMIFRTILSISILVLGGTSCRLSTATPPSTTVPIRECLVDLSPFPSGWSVEFGPDAYDLPGRVLPGRALAGISISFHWRGPNALAQHDVLKYETKQRAASEFHRQQPGTFFSAGRLTPWETPDAVSYQSPFADQFRLACADIEGAEQRFKLCIAMGQYDKHLSTFAIWMSPDYMTFADLERILEAIDERMAHCTGQPFPTAENTR